MSKFVYLDGAIIESRSADIPALSAAALYGKSVFSTIAIRRGNAFLWDKHWKRLKRDSAQLGLNISDIDQAAVHAGLEELIGADVSGTLRARITIFDAGTPSTWRFDLPAKSRVLIMVRPIRQRPDIFRITTSEYIINSRSPLSGIKSCNYLEHLLALKDANDRGFHEAVRTDENGDIASACMANVFWLKNGKLFTPDLATGCLPGTTREHVLENLQCAEVKAGIDELQAADAVFLTSAGIGVAQAAEFEGRNLSPSNHEILKLIPQIK